MALVVETGEGVDGANSYVTLAEARAYAADRGVTLSSDDAVLTPLLIVAADYLESFASRFKGYIFTVGQALSWPRSDVVIYDEDFAEDAIPIALKIAQIKLVIEQSNGVNIMPTITGKFVVREKIGPIETQYSEAVNVDGLPSFPYIDSTLEPLLDRYTGFALTSIRI